MTALATKINRRSYSKAPTSKINSKMALKKKDAAPPSPPLAWDTTAVALTDFQRRVYQALCQVPAGQVTTYRDLGRHIQCSRGAQAIGQALKRNPCAPVVPCHRVVRSDGTLGGFTGHLQGPEWERKRQLLLQEGVMFVDPPQNTKISPACLYQFEPEKSYSECIRKMEPEK